MFCLFLLILFTSSFFTVTVPWRPVGSTWESTRKYTRECLKELEGGKERERESERGLILRLRFNCLMDVINVFKTSSVSSVKYGVDKKSLN